jgi:hypothetical protein
LKGPLPTSIVVPGLFSRRFVAWGLLHSFIKCVGIWRDDSYGITDGMVVVQYDVHVRPSQTFILCKMAVV